jgi:hypothetical protein
MSSLGRTLQSNDIACPNCGGKRCSIHWEGGACSNCDGSGNWKERGANTCRRCDGGKKKAWVKCFRDGKGYDLDSSVAGSRPPLKPSSPRATDAFVDLIYTAFLERCHLTEDWREHLGTERALSSETIEAAGFVTLPKQETCNRFAAEIAETIKPPVGVPGFYEHEGMWHFRRTLHWRDSGLVIPYRNISGQIVMLQVRSNGDDPKKRYMCISGAPSYVSHAGTGSGAPAHWLPFDRDAQTALITEGGLKAVVIKELWERMKREPKLGPIAFIGLSGLNAPHGFMEGLRTALPQLRRVIFAFDREIRDTCAGESVARIRKTLMRDCASWGLQVAEEPGGWRQDGERKFDDYLRGLVK